MTAPGAAVSPAQEAAVAKVLGEHRLHASMNICTGCDWRATPNSGSLADQHTAHVAAALLASDEFAEVLAGARAEAVGEFAGVVSGAMRSLAAQDALSGADQRTWTAAWSAAASRVTRCAEEDAQLRADAAGGRR